ncbi:hypothetical protein QP028_09415 [Corynebacterium suedekumii]|nr:hypothetical protein QP028_09415 [Corynebacterium suedekumii]
MAKDIMWSYPASAAAVVMLSQGIALLLRQTAGAVALMLIWFMGLEQIFRLVPRIGSDIVRFLPLREPQRVHQRHRHRGRALEHPRFRRVLPRLGARRVDPRRGRPAPPRRLTPERAGIPRQRHICPGRVIGWVVLPTTVVTA